MRLLKDSSNNIKISSFFLKIALVAVINLGTYTTAYAGANNNATLKEINLLSEQGNQAAALEKVNAYLNANPKDAEALFMKGVILVEAGKRDEAIKAFTDLTEKYPNLPEPYNNLAVLYADQGQYDKARKALETAIKTHPSYATAHENLGDIYARLASEAYDKAFKLDASNARAQNKLSMITDLFGGTKTATAAAKPATSAVVASKETKPTETVKTPAAKPTESKKPDSTANSSEEASIIDAVEGWAKAWSAQDVDQYLASYADTFKTPKGESRKAWEKMRRERVSNPKSISVDVGNPKVVMDGDNAATISFYQTYKANGKPQGTAKTLKMIKEASGWKINQEIARN